MKKHSIWEISNPPKYPSLSKEETVDILIIGGGISGISLLYELRNSKQKICLVEKNEIGMGVTKNTTAKISYLQGIVYSKIAQQVSLSHALLYLDSQQKAIARIKEIVSQEKISCDFTKVISYLYGPKESIKKEYQFLKNAGSSVFYQENYLWAEDTYVFHPLKYLYALASICTQKKKSIYEHTIITKIQKEKNGYCCYGTHPIHAHKVVLTCHYPFFLFPFFFPIRTWIEKSFIMAKKDQNLKPKTLLTTTKPILSIRNTLESQIILRNSHNICTHWSQKENFQPFLNENPDYIWSNEDIMTADKMPFIGSIKPNLYLATGYNTWGMANSTLAAMILKDALTNQPNPYFQVFDPKRKMSLAKIKQYPLNIEFNLLSFIRSKTIRQKSWYPKNIKCLTYHGKKIAIYETEKKRYIVSTTCPHMGCSLIFNAVEETWECPCHASKFDKTGKCIKGPSTASIKMDLDI